MRVEEEKRLYMHMYKLKIQKEDVKKVTGKKVRHDTCFLSSDGQDVAGLTGARTVLGKHADVVR